MKIVYHHSFSQPDEIVDGASTPGRIEAIMQVLEAQSGVEFLTPTPAEETAILRAHSPTFLDAARIHPNRFATARLAAGGAILAAERGFAGDPTFACIRPPGHHASRDSTWGYCVFCNMAVALLHLRATRQISSAFILDFDAHTGDGTKAVLEDWKECRILNPYAEDPRAYVQEIIDFTREIASIDIVAICAGFDSYEKDVGGKLSTFEFYEIGVLMKKFSRRAAQDRRFAILEGGYYQPDLGKNVLAFCQGFL